MMKNQTVIDMTTLPVFSTERFYWDSDVKTFFADITDIENSMIDQINLKKGFSLKSHKTGVERKVYFDRCMHDFDSDLVGWKFISECKTFYVQILND